MSNYTTNYCPNPSFQLGLQGYSSILNGVLVLDTSKKLFGAAQSLRVTTPGSHAGEGVITAGGVIPTNSVSSVSLYIQGAGSVQVTAVTNPGAVVQGSTPVTLVNNSWQRVVINNISCSPGQKLYLTVTTSSVQAATFWISGIQVEASSPAHPYCDGDQPGCSWTNTTPSISVQPNEYGADGVGNSIATGNIVNVLQQGATSSTGAIGGISKALGNRVAVGSANPVAVFDDFSIFQLTDTDPAQTYVNLNNAGTTSGTSGAYTRVWGTFYPPLDYYVSGGAKLWSRAAYMAAGFQFTNVPASGSQNIADVQVELLPMSSSTPVTYTLPRQLNTIVKPDRLNFCTNPSFETSTANWTANGAATLTTDATVSLGTILTYDDVASGSNQSMKITITASGDGCQTVISNLIVGNTYTVSAYVQAGPGIANISLACGSGSSSASSSGSPYGSGMYGLVPYGGVTLTGSDLTTGVWFRPTFQFVATAPSHTLVLTFVPGGDIVYNTHIWVDGVMVELGAEALTYFDGGFGANAFWEGTANLSRSYYYDQYYVKQQAVTNVLAKHTPLGISYSTPVFSVPYTQS